MRQYYGIIPTLENYMDKPGAKIWYHVDDLLYKRQVVYTGKFPQYFSSVSFAWCNFLADNREVIIAEFDKYFEKEKLKPYFYEDQAGNTGKWRTLPLITWGIKRKNLKNFVNTANLLNQIPGLVSASFSMLEAGGEIMEHYGDTDAHIRGHLCLKASDDRENLCFTVGGVTEHWEEGKWILFCDAHLHGGFNRTNKDRLIMIIDVLHDENMSLKNTICAKVMAGLMLNFVFVKLGIDMSEKENKWYYGPVYILFKTIFKLLIILKIKL